MTVESYEGLIRVIAYDHARNVPDIDDVLQEARLKVWQTLQDTPDASKALLAACIRNAVRNCVAHKLWTGHTRTQGKTDAYAHAVPMPEGYDAAAAPMVGEPVVYNPRVREAIAKLDERERKYVYDRFWLELPTRMQDRFLWAQKIKPKLKLALAECV